MTPPPMRPWWEYTALGCHLVAQLALMEVAARWCFLYDDYDGLD